MRVHLTKKSSNRKTGPMAVSTTTSDSCPPECPLATEKKGCYAQRGHTGMFWRSVDNGKFGKDWEGFIKQLKKLPKGKMFRHNQAGDLPGRNGKLDSRRVLKLRDAVEHLKAATYTHYDPSVGQNKALLKDLNQTMTVNLSGNSLEHADELHEKTNGELPLTGIIENNQKLGTRSVKDLPRRTPGGLPMVVCPNQTKEGKGMTCRECRLCWRKDRKFVVGFLKH